jgi:hypothetical protein
MTHKTLNLKANVPSNIPFQREYSAIFRFSYERFIELKTEKQIRPEVKIRWPKVNSWMAHCAILSAKAEYKAHKALIQSGQRKSKVIWGSKKNFDKKKRRNIKSRISKSKITTYINTRRSKTRFK